MYRKKIVSDPVRFGKSIGIYLLCICTAVLFTLGLVEQINMQINTTHLNAGTTQTDAFRRMELTEESLPFLESFAAEHDLEFADVLAVILADRDFDLSAWRLSDFTIDQFQSLHSEMKKYSRDAYQELLEAYQAIWSDLVYFPVPVSSQTTKNDVKKDFSFENSWMFERNYGGTRGHEGCDIMTKLNEPGIYPVLSMTDGVVEKVGWLEKGGWRVGIRAEHGAYFYYAHLSEYAQDFQPGDSIKAGDLLGFMGDSGYGEEGTTGQFDVHLHLGIYIPTPHQDDISVNPYWVLRYLEGEELSYTY